MATQRASMRGRVRLAAWSSALIVLGFLAIWFFVSRAVLGDTALSGVSLAPTDGPAPLAVTATYSDYQLIPGTRLLFNFGDGTIVDNPEGFNSGSVKRTTVEHTYTQPGYYTFRLELHRPGHSDVPTHRQLVRVREPIPAPGFTVSPTLGPAPLKVNAVYHDYDLYPGTTVTIDWNDGTTPVAASAENLGSVRRFKADHILRQPGNYRVMMELQTPSLGIRRSEFQYVTVTAAQPIDFSADLPNTNRPLQVRYVWEGGALYCGGSLYRSCEGLSWNFGNGVTRTNDQPVTIVQYAAPGTYTVTLDFRGVLSKTKTFELMADGKIKEVGPQTAPPNLQTPKIVAISVDGRPAALVTRLSITEGSTVEIVGTATPKSSLDVTLENTPNFATLTTTGTKRVVGDDDGKWTYEASVASAGQYTIFGQPVGAAERTRLLELAVTAKPAGTSSSGSPPAAGSGPSGGSASSGTAASQTRNEAELVSTAQQATGLQGALVRTGSNLSLMLLLAVLLAGATSYLVIRRPWEHSLNQE